MLINNDTIIKQIDDSKEFIHGIFKEQLISRPFYDDFSRRFCWSSNHLEGNTLSLDETIELVEYDSVRSNHTYSEYTEAKLLYKTIQEFMIPFKKSEITETYVKSINASIGLDGEYRTDNVYIESLTEAVYYPPKWENVCSLMEEYIRSVNYLDNGSIRDAINYIAKKHVEFERIHPFKDGNGRTGRMILNQQLINCGLLPVCIDKTSDYRQAFKVYDKNGDLSKMVHLICKEIIRSFERVSLLYGKLKNCNNQCI